MNVVDSSAWIEYLGDGPRAPEFAAAIESRDRLIVPSISILEVFKRVGQLAGETGALEAASLMLQGEVVDLSASLALEAARMSTEHGLSTADAIILATARSRDAVLWTQDAHFEGLPNVQYRPKPRSR